MLLVLGGKKIVQKPCECSIMKNLNFDIGNFSNTEKDKWRIRKTPMSKFD